MNEKGETTLLSCLLILLLTGLVLLCALELRKSFRLLEKRTHLFLCAKETKGELHLFLTFMGRTNWGIKNLNRASIIMLFIPGAQGAAMDAQKLKKYLQWAQNARLVSYLKTLKGIQSKQCPLDPRMFITPFKFGTSILERDSDGGAILREEEWTYGYFLKPYFLALNVKASEWEKYNPKINYEAKEKMVKLSSLWSSL